MVLIKLQIYHTIVCLQVRGKYATFSTFFFNL